MIKIAEGVNAFYEDVIDMLAAVSEVKAPWNCLPYFNPMLKNEVPDGFTKNNSQKCKYCNMSDEEFPGVT
jgi:hypothetical protein